MIRNFIFDRFIYPISSKFKRIYEAIYFRKLRANLKNQSFSLFSPNCYAGIIYHRLGLEYTSPTINLLFPVKKQYLRFVSNLEYYLEKDLVFINDPMYLCPVAILEDVKIIFNHYDSIEQAEDAWNRRKKRVNYSNIFIIFDDIADAEYQDLLDFNSIQCAGKIILTAKKYENIPNTIQISKYKRNESMKPYLMDINLWTGKNAADKDFDFVNWLNSATVE